MQGLGGEKTQNLLGEDLAKLGQNRRRGAAMGERSLTRRGENRADLHVC